MSETENRKVLVLRRTRGGLQSEVQPIVIEYKKRRKKKAVEGEGEDRRRPAEEEIGRGAVVVAEQPRAVAQRRDGRDHEDPRGEPPAVARRVQAVAAIARSGASSSSARSISCSVLK